MKRSNLIIFGIIILLTLIGSYLLINKMLTASDSDSSPFDQRDNVADTENQEQNNPKTPTRNVDAEPVETASVRTVDVPIGNSDASEKVVLNNYEDPNYPFSVTFPNGYSYDITETAVFFKSRERSMFFTAEVIFTFKNGGLFNDLDDVKDDYIGQLEEYGPTVLSSETKKLNNNDVLVFDVRYIIEGRGAYINSFAVGMDEEFFYVLQFLTPEVEFETEKVLIEEIMEDFLFAQ